jgi:hypothetical protein
VTITGKPHEEILQEMAKCDLYIDQLLIGYYGVSAMECAAMGVPVVCYVKKCFKSPFINATSDSVYDVLEFIIDNKWALPMVSERGKKYYTECKRELETVYEKDKRNKDNCKKKY